MGGTKIEDLSFRTHPLPASYLHPLPFDAFFKKVSFSAAPLKKRKRKIKYRVGDLVRINRAKAAFEKDYEAEWSEEIFQIYRVLDWRNPHVYELRDLADEVIDSIFYEQELARVEKNLEEEQFIIDRVIKSRGRGANKKVLVSWRSYPSKFDTWIPASSLISLRDGRETISSDTSK